MQAAPLSIVIVEVLKHTPAYVWGILAALIIVGRLQLRDQTIGRARLLLLPVALGAYSLWGSASAFGMRWEVLAAWVVGMGTMLLSTRWVRWPRKVEFLPERGVFAVGGSVIPLVAMLAVFAVRYVATVTLILHPEWRSLASVAIVGGLGYGLLSGVFAMRARNILANAGPNLRFQPA
ncbi:MAG TPA: DUF6622 family protein [Burkholderiaceae bacterium]|nr:DUF6622 family protein [Burkholderiaceae bacterium]